MDDKSQTLEQENKELKERLLQIISQLDLLEKNQYREGCTSPFCEAVVEIMKDGVLFLSENEEIFYANPGFCEILNYKKPDVIGRSIYDFVSEDHKPFFKEALAEDGKKLLEYHFVNIHGDKVVFQLEIMKGTWQESKGYLVWLKDVTKLKKALNFIEATEAIIKILSEAPTLATALKQIIEILYNVLGWEVIIIWQWNEKESILKCLKSAHTASFNPETFLSVSEQMELSQSQMPSHVWSTFRPYWIEDVSKEPSFLRNKEADLDNIHGVLAFPFYQGSKLGGVVELFRRKPMQEELDSLAQNIITTIGIEIGLFLQKKAFEEIGIQFSTILEFSPSAIFSVDMEGIVKDWNPSAERIYGWPSREIVGNSIKLVYPDERLPEFDYLEQTLLKGKVVQNFKTERKRKDGETITINISCGPIVDALGKYAGACVIVEDVTSQTKGLEALKYSEERLKSFIATTGEWIWEADKDGILSFSNPAIVNILGYQPEELIGKNISNFIGNEGLKNIEKTYSSSLGWIQEKTIRCSHKNGSERWLEVKISELLDHNHVLIGFRGAGRDITESKNLLKIQNEFISLVNHELRTPLTSIYGALSLLTKRTLRSDEKDKLLDTALRNTERLTNIVNDIIDVEKLQLGKFEFHFKPINLREVIQESIKSSEIIASKFNVKISLTASPPIIEVEGDQFRLLQVMLNLLSNAIKFSPPLGVVTVTLENKGDVAKVSVTDKGPGIIDEFKPKVFQRFAQADLSSKRYYQGTGLGLSICKSIIDGHHGVIQYTTKVGEGTTFYFEIPKKQPSVL